VEGVRDLCVCVQDEVWNKQSKAAQAYIHAIDIVWHHCLELGCEYRAKMKSSVKMHRALVHDIGVTWHYCPEPNCTYKAKKKKYLKQHRAQVHGINVTWHVCTELGCEYKAMREGHLKFIQRHATVLYLLLYSDWGSDRTVPLPQPQRRLGARPAICVAAVA